MTARLLRTLPVLVMIGAAACTAPAPPAAAPPPAPPPPAPITQAALEQGVQELTAALVAGDGTKAGGLYAPDATLISAKGKADTRSSIEAFWTGALKTPGAGKNLKLEVQKWGASGDMAYSVSRFTGGITAPSGYVLSVVERQADGSLRTLAQVSIPDPPAAK